MSPLPLWAPVLSGDGSLFGMTTKKRDAFGISRSALMIFSATASGRTLSSPSSMMMDTGSCMSYSLQDLATYLGVTYDVARGAKKRMGIEAVIGERLDNDDASRIIREVRRHQGAKAISSAERR